MDEILEENRSYSLTAFKQSTSLSENTHFVYKAQQYIHEHYREKITLDDIAQSVHKSRYHFAREFKKATGISTALYVDLVRLELAEKLLINSSFNIGDIATIAGMASYNRFRNLFYARHAMNPIKYRIKHSRS